MPRASWRRTTCPATGSSVRRASVGGSSSEETRGFSRTAHRPFGPTKGRFSFPPSDELGFQGRWPARRRETASTLTTEENDRLNHAHRSPFGGRPMAGRRVLTPQAEVRFLAPEPTQLASRGAVAAGAIANSPIRAPLTLPADWGRSG